MWGTRVEDYSSSPPITASTGDESVVLPPDVRGLHHGQEENMMAAPFSIGRAVLKRTMRLQNANKPVIRSLFRKLQFAGAAVAKGGQFYTDSHFIRGALAEGYRQLSGLTAFALTGTFVVARDWL
jgi:hypothetical protein